MQRATGQAACALVSLPDQWPSENKIMCEMGVTNCLKYGSYRSRGLKLHSKVQKLKLINYAHGNLRHIWIQNNDKGYVTRKLYKFLNLGKKLIQVHKSA